MHSQLNASKELLACLILSKEEFALQYCRFQRQAEAKKLYLLVLTEIKKAISDGNIKTFKNLCNFIESISKVENNNTLKDFYNDVDNPIRKTNLVILSCMHNQIKILAYIFCNFKILKDISFDTVDPCDFDEECHNSFYYAIRSGNVELIKMLINKWPENYFTVHFTELEKILSTSYEELKLKNVPVSNEMELFIENELLSLRFFSNDSAVQSINLNTIEDRVQLVIENITLLIDEYYSDMKEIDERFIYIAKFIVQNIHILKQLLKSTYDKLPWEEIEFCTVCFVSCYMRQKEINLFTFATLNKCRILDHLKSFSKQLKDVFGDIHSLEKTALPNQNRENVIEQIVKNYPQFENLYNDYDIIRDVHSLETINNYIKLAVSTDFQNKESKIIIARILQVIGEYFKNTLLSPKLSKNTSELLLLTLPKNTREIIINLRNSLSHAHSLLKRIEIENNVNINFFTGVQHDIKKIGSVISDILYRKKIKTIKILVKKIISSESFDEINEVLKIFSTNINLHEVNSANMMADNEKLEKLILKLKKSMTDKTHAKQNQFVEIISKIHLHKKKMKNIEYNYFIGLMFLKGFSAFNNVKIDKNVIRGLKFHANQSLQYINLEMEFDSLTKIDYLLSNIFKSVRLETQENAEEIFKSILEFYSIAQFDINNIKWIEELRGKLNDKYSFFSSTQEKTFMLHDEKCHEQLKLKLFELKNILKDLLGNPVSVQHISYFKSDNKLQALVEMLVLDIMSILDSFKKCLLETNLYFLDETIPLLIGKSLRNHLAHNNAIVDLMLFDPLVVLFLNAKKLTVENINECKKKIGKFVINDPLNLKIRYIQRLFTITNQKNMFVAIEKGNLRDFESCLKDGADINAKNFKLWTALHFAAKGSCLSVIKFILENKSDLDVKNAAGQTPLHIAAEYGRKSIVEYFVKEILMSVDDVDNYGKTPLHIAAQNGHKDVVEILLKHNANNLKKDLSGLSPLHFAIANGHVETIKILLGNDTSVDINETMGGYTPLHQAAERGHLELVNFLIQKSANINAKTDKNWTPLHAAALNGYLEIVNVLILRGAEVNAQVIGGCTPLHYAVENGHEKIVDVLVKHNAYVNVFDETYNNMPLHYAAKDGYEKIVTILIKNKANASAVTVDGMTPLHFAALEGHVQIAIALLEHGVDIDARNFNYSTPLHCASEMGHKSVVKLLIKNKALINAQDLKLFTPLHLAASKNHSDIAEILIENNAEVNNKTLKGYSPLHSAAINCSINTIDFLIKNNADINATDASGCTPLHSAVIQGQNQAVDFLVKTGAQVNVKDSEKYTPLHAAAINGHKDIMDILIKNSAEVNARDIYGCTPLHMAVEAGFKEAVEILITNGADVNAINESKMTPLLSAVTQNYKDIVQYLISNNAVVNIKNNEALSLAVYGGYIAIVEILLKNKVGINAKYIRNSPLLHIATKRGNAEIVKCLIKQGYSVSTKFLNATPLYLAAELGYEEISEVLIANGADVNVKCFEGNTSLHIASGKGHANVVKVLLKYNANINIKDGKNRLPLELAVAHGHLQIVKSLMQYTVNINAKANDDWTVLHIAAQENNLEILKYLVKNGSDINAKNASGSKPIHISAREGFKDALEFFLSKGSSVNDLGAVNQTLLHYASFGGQLEIVRYLITQGADLNAKDNNGRTPMHFAAAYGYKSILKVLLENGAIYNILDKFRLKPSDMTEHKDISILLSSIEKLFEAVKHNSPTEVETCIEAGALVNILNVAGDTPLHYAAWKGSIEVANILLEKKANANAVGKKGCTPLHYAANFSHMNIIKALLCNGAVYDPLSDNGKTPLNFAKDEKIAFLLEFISTSFKNVNYRNCKVINDLNKIKDVYTMKAIMNARNRDNRTLVVAAMHNNFPKVKQLKEILQDGVSAKINEALGFCSEGKYKKAFIIYKSILEKRKEVLGPDNPGTLDIQAYIGQVLYKQGLYHDALNTLEEIFQKQKLFFGDNYKETLNTRSTIALTLHRLQRNEEALKIFQEVYLNQRVLLGPNHPDTLNTNFHMALVLDSLGKYEEALSINQEVYKQRKDANDPTAVYAQNNIAMVLSKQGKHEEALKIYTEVLEQKKILLGKTHPDTLRTLQHIAGLQLKNYPEDLKAHEEILNLKKNVLGLNHPDTLNSQFAMANVFFTQGKWITALKLFKEVSLRRKSIWGDNDPIFLKSLKMIEEINNLKLKLEVEESDITQYLQTQMHIAADDGDTQCIEELLKYGADINEKDADGRTPLHYAVNNGHIHVVMILLKSGADATQITNKGNTPLHTAASKGYNDIVINLLEYVIHNKPNFINAQTFIGGNTALHVAAKIGSLSIALSLLKHGAMYNVQNKESKTPYDLSTNLNINSILKLVSELYQDAINGNEKIITKLKAVKQHEYSAIANVRNSEEKTILQVVISNKHKIIATELLKMLKSIDSNVV